MSIVWKDDKMDYEITDLAEKCKYLLKVIEEDCRVSKATRDQIERLKKASINRSNQTEQEEIDELNSMFDEEEDLVDPFEDEVLFYLQDYRALEPGFSEDDFFAILPSRKGYNYQKIMYRLIAESIKDIKELRELMYEEDSISSEELNEYNLLLENEKRKIEMLKQALKAPKSMFEEETKNTVLLVPTEALNIRVIDELEHVPIEYHERFLELINSIIDGTFKNVKTLTNNKYLSGISEVKVFGARVVFERIGRNCYAIITAFIKKSTYDKAYAETLRSKVSDYKRNAESIKALQYDDNFMQENAEHLAYLLEMPGEDDKKRVRGV